MKHLILWALWGAAITALVWLQVRRARREDADRDRRIADTRTLADQDACELIWSMPAYDPDGTAGLDRLRKAVRDEQQNGDT